MRIAATVVGLAQLASLISAHAQTQIDASNCTPQPSCKILYPTVQGGALRQNGFANAPVQSMAPETGIKSQGGSMAPGTFTGVDK